MRAVLALLLVAVLGCAARAPLPPPTAAPPAAAGQPEEPPPPPPRLAALEGLLTLRGYATAFHYVPGTLDRAAHTQSRLEALAETFFKVGRQPPMIEVWVLDRETWEGAGLERPYGLPQVVGPAAYAIPGWGDEGTVAAVEELLGGPVDPLRDVPLRGTAEEGGALAVADALLQIDASLDLMLSTGLEVEQPWLLGLLSQLLARLTFERFEPGRMPEIAALFDAMAAAHGGPQAHRLEDYRIDLPLEEDVWYQAQLLRGADVIWVKEGGTASSRWLYWLLDRGKPVPRAEVEKRFKGLAEWERASFAP
jgi:hypothetical protein